MELNEIKELKVQAKRFAGSLLIVLEIWVLATLVVPCPLLKY